MKLFVTVGTTAFDELVKFVDQEPFFDDFDVTIQYGPGQYIPKNRNNFAFIKNIEEEYLAADFVICHGGAGTIYRLLELSVPLCAVANLERIDDHQLDICHNLSNHNFIFSVKKIYDIPDRIRIFSNGNITFEKFQKESFFCAQKISDYFLK